MSKLLLFLLVFQLALFSGIANAQVVNTELAGNSLTGFPYFEFIRAFNADAPVKIAVDLTRFPSLAGVTTDIYVVESQTVWSMGDPLVDAGSGPETTTWPTTAPGRIVRVATAGELDSYAGIDIGVPYDVVIDADQDGVLSDGDFLDGPTTEAGFYVVKDLVETGPLNTEYVDYSVTGVSYGYEEERTWYPSAIAGLGQLPLVIISHGNGHNYRWYDYLQEHIASYGYIVMSHENKTGPGIESASTTTLEHTDAIIEQQGTIAGGVLDGHIDSNRIVWIGHSRGGEGVARAYDRIYDGTWTPEYYTQDDIVLISSIAPTDFLGYSSSNPHGANYHFLYGSADGDVSGTPSNDVAQAFHILERATGFRQSTYVQGADHNDFNSSGFNDFSGPPGTEIGRTEAQRVAKADYLAVIKHYVEGNVPAKDYLWRQYESFKPIGVSSETIVVHEYKESPSEGKFVIDDYESNPSFTQSSSGGNVMFRIDETAAAEGLLDDNNSSFTWYSSDPFNGMTRARTNDHTDGVVFNATPSDKVQYMTWEIVDGQQDFTGFKYLSFRACQGTRHPNTVARLRNETWRVGLKDGNNKIKLIDFAVYGGGIEEPYQRTGTGTGAGWQNEFETIRIRLTDFLAAGGDASTNLDLSDIHMVGFLFVDSEGPITARIGLDDLEVTVD
jgi:hypothetical protein